MNRTIKRSVTLSLLGAVALSTVGGMIFSADANENKTATSYSVSGASSSVYYGSHDTYSTEKSGLVVKLAPNDTFNYNKAIDLSKMTADDNLLSLFPTPSVIGTSNAHFLTMVLTDAYDSSNKITITCWDPWQDKWGADHIYMKTGAVGQTYAGKSSLTGTIHKGGDYGTEGLVSFSGQESGDKEVGSREITIAFDYEEKQLFGTQYNISNPLVADYDSTDFFDLIWDGFTTGEVFLSIMAENYNASTFDFVVTNIAGEDLSQATFTPDKKPTLNVDLEEFGDNVQTVTGEFFHIPACTAYSIYDDSLTVHTKVLFDGTEIPINNGGFVPTEVGEYTIVYETQDDYGNSSVREVNVMVTIAEKDLHIVLFNEKTTFNAGERVKIAQSVNFAGDIVGEAKLSITATLVGNTSVQYTIDPNTLLFTPKVAGQYVVRYEYSDYVQSGTKLRMVTVEKTANAYLYDLPELPNYLIKGAKYVLPTTYGYTCVSGKAEDIKANIYTIADGGEEKKLDGNVYRVKANESVKIIYRVESNEATDEISKTIPVVDVGYGGSLIAQNYFATVAGEIEGLATEENVSFVFATDGKKQFVNTVQGVNFTTKFAVTGSAYKSFVIYLTDSIDETQTIKLTYAIYNDSKTSFSINDGAVYTINKSVMVGTIFDLVYNNSTRIVKVTEKLSLPITKTLYGETFEGFSSSKVDFSFAVNGVKENVKVDLYKINNQPFYDFGMDGDFVVPEVVVNAMRGDRNPNEKITISPAIICDVLDPYIECTLNVLKPDGVSYVVALDGTVLSNITDYTTTFSYIVEEYGSYLTAYRIKDGYANSTSYGYQNTVKDMVEPELTLKGEKVTTASVGDTVNLLKATANDANDGECKVFIYLEKPDGTLLNVTESISFVANYAGTYTVYYYTCDNAGNMAFESYKIIIS